MEVPAARLEGLKAPRRQALQGFRVFCGPEGSVEHEEP